MHRPTSINQSRGVKGSPTIRSSAAAATAVRCGNNGGSSRSSKGESRHVALVPHRTSPDLKVCDGLAALADDPAHQVRRAIHLLPGLEYLGQFGRQAVLRAHREPQRRRPVLGRLRGTAGMANLQREELPGASGSFWREEHPSGRGCISQQSRLQKDCSRSTRALLTITSQRTSGLHHRNARRGVGPDPKERPEGETESHLEFKNRKGDGPA